MLGLNYLIIHHLNVFPPVLHKALSLRQNIIIEISCPVYLGMAMEINSVKITENIFNISQPIVFFWTQFNYGSLTLYS